MPHLLDKCALLLSDAPTYMFVGYDQVNFLPFFGQAKSFEHLKPLITKNVFWTWNHSCSSSLKPFNFFQFIFERQPELNSIL